MVTSITSVPREPLEKFGDMRAGAAWCGDSGVLPSRSTMNDDRVVEFPVRYEGEIALAERSYDLLAERLARGRLPDETSPQGVMYTR